MPKSQFAGSSAENEPGTLQHLHRRAGQALAGRSTPTEGNDDAFEPLTDWMPVQDLNCGDLIDALRRALVGHERNDDEPDGSCKKVVTCSDDPEACLDDLVPPEVSS